MRSPFSLLPIGKETRMSRNDELVAFVTGGSLGIGKGVGRALVNAVPRSTSLACTASSGALSRSFPTGHVTTRHQMGSTTGRPDTNQDLVRNFYQQK